MPATLIRGATVITMDSQGDLPRADILVQDDRIAAIAPTLAADDAQVVDAAGCIVIPGLINAHMHTWQTALRGVAANWTLLEYFQKMHAGLATAFGPQDLHIATRVGALNQLNCGTTTLADWCHNNPTPGHNDAAIDGLLSTGIRAAFFHGTPKPDPKPGQQPFWEVPHPRAEVERLAKKHQGHALLSIQAAVLGPHYSTLEVALHDFRMARELGLIASMHQGGGAARTPDGWQRLEEAGLLGPHINIVHGHALSEEQLQRFCELGMSFSAAAESEMSQGHGHPLTGRLRRYGRAPSLGVDLESVLSGDMLTQARVALGIQRSLDNVAHREQHGTIPSTSTIRTREALAWVTIEGARMLQQQDRIGSLAPGKQADLVVIRASDLNMQPVHDPVSAVVFQASLANIDSVMVAGRWKKRAGRLVGAENLEADLATLRASGEKILRAMGLG
ncbi:MULTISPECIES: amidohydrolase family protein [Ramlibacter]|uniref:Amidohydrolase family protein n=1 Tax=Ramlibacter pinisoli TaxID=2682844 RepID=A0A6N8IVC8_9BURK|nr:MULTISPECIES: amidohydrolase family protein [Ramlibacter]MBA2965125.1 amidohydrolase family protein [Ramlibacter sp. CGMCC 1.13660]MVQ30090.1 amidohydrolase family protein [Ramlibacter pinisoli]